MVVGLRQNVFGWHARGISWLRLLFVMAVLDISALDIAAQPRCVVERPKRKGVMSDIGTWSRDLYVHASFSTSRVGSLQIARKIPVQRAGRQCVQRKVGKRCTVLMAHRLRRRSRKHEAQLPNLGTLNRRGPYAWLVNMSRVEGSVLDCTVQYRESLRTQYLPFEEE